jgi:hypothetical protein
MRSDVIILPAPFVDDSFGLINPDCCNMHNRWLVLIVGSKQLQHGTNDAEGGSRPHHQRKIGL